MADEHSTPEGGYKVGREPASEHTRADLLEGSHVTVVLDRQPVELYKILKFEGLAGSGAQAKQLIDDGLVSVNGEVELRRRRKIIAEDLIQFGPDTLLMVVATHE